MQEFVNEKGEVTTLTTDKPLNTTTQGQPTDAPPADLAYLRYCPVAGFPAEMAVKHDETYTYRAFTNSCPHQGNSSQWSYNTSQDRFVCGAHNNSYPTDCTTSGTAGGALKCYTTTLNDGKLTVNKS